MNNNYFIIVFNSEDIDEIEEVLFFDNEIDVWSRVASLFHHNKQFKVFKGVILMGNA